MELGFRQLLTRFQVKLEGVRKPVSVRSQSNSPQHLLPLCTGTIGAYLSSEGEEFCQLPVPLILAREYAQLSSITRSVAPERVGGAVARVPFASAERAGGAPFAAPIGGKEVG